LAARARARRRPPPRRTTRRRSAWPRSCRPSAFSARRRRSCCSSIPRAKVVAAALCTDSTWLSSASACSRAWACPCSPSSRGPASRPWPRCRSGGWWRPWRPCSRRQRCAWP
ncbi:hypothetical protein BAE44_0025479, partial [Dichanthelium oligosanthes]